MITPAKVAEPPRVGAVCRLRKQPLPEPYGICPLCERAFPRVRLENPLRSEPPESRVEIVAAIREDRPGWSEKDGTCRDCWESFRGVVRVLRFINRFKFPDRL